MILLLMYPFIYIFFQICLVEDILIEGVIQQFVVHFHKARTVNVPITGTVSTSRMGMYANRLQFLLL